MKHLKNGASGAQSLRGARADAGVSYRRFKMEERVPRRTERMQRAHLPDASKPAVSYCSMGQGREGTSTELLPAGAWFMSGGGSARVSAWQC